MQPVDCGHLVRLAPVLTARVHLQRLVSCPKQRQLRSDSKVQATVCRALLRVSSVCLPLQDSKPTVVLSLQFMKGSITFIGLSALPVVPPQPVAAALTAAATAAWTAAWTAASTAAVLSQTAGLPGRMQSALSQEGVFLPKGVSTEYACSPKFFAHAHQHRVSAGLWVRNSKLAAVLKHLLAPPSSSIPST